MKIKNEEDSQQMPSTNEIGVQRRKSVWQAEYRGKGFGWRLWDSFHGEFFLKTLEACFQKTKFYE